MKMLSFVTSVIVCPLNWIKFEATHFKTFLHFLRIQILQPIKCSSSSSMWSIFSMMSSRVDSAQECHRSHNLADGANIRVCSFGGTLQCYWIVKKLRHSWGLMNPGVYSISMHRIGLAVFSSNTLASQRRKPLNGTRSWTRCVTRRYSIRQAGIRPWCSSTRARRQKIYRIWPWKKRQSHILSNPMVTWEV